MASIIEQKEKTDTTDAPSNPPTFTPVNHTFSFLESKKNNELLMKWNVLPDFKIHRFRSSVHISKSSPSNLPTILKSFITSPSVCSVLGTSSVPDASAITLTPLSCTVLNMNFFDAVTFEDEVVTSTDLIRGCMDDTFDGILVQDKLREMMLNPDSENCHIFKEGEKKEWIYHLLKLFVVGGSMCQSEDRFREYREITKAVYKDTVSVQKSAKTGKVEITSQVYHVDPWGTTPELWKKQSVHNKYYIIVDTTQGWINVVYKPFVPFW